MKIRNSREILNALKKLAPIVEKRFEEKLFNNFGDRLVDLFKIAMDDAIYSFPVPEDVDHPYNRTEALRDSVDIQKTDKGVLVYVNREVLLELAAERGPEENPDREPKGSWPYDLYTSGKNGTPTVYSGESYFQEAHLQMLHFIATELAGTGDFRL